MKLVAFYEHNDKVYTIAFGMTVKLNDVEMKIILLGDWRMLLRQITYAYQYLLSIFLSAIGIMVMLGFLMAGSVKEEPSIYWT